MSTIEDVTVIVEVGPQGPSGSLTTVATDAIWDAKGDLVGGTGANTAARLPVGFNGTVLSADSAEATGLKWIAVSGTGTVTSVSVTTANGVSGSVATSTTTPAISLTLGAITPSSVAASSTVTGSNLSGTNTGDQSLFSTIAVSGQSNVVADSTSDTLTLVAGTNVTITTDAATDSITINASGGGGGSGDVVGPASATDNAVVRFDSTTGKLVQNSVVTIADTTGNMAGVGTLNTHTIPGGTGTIALTSNITGTNSGTNTGDQTITLSGAVTGSGTGAITATFATPGTNTVSSTNSNANAHTHAITSSSEPGAAASLLATDASGHLGSTGTRIVKGWFTDITATNAISGSITGNAATVTTNANLTGDVTSSGNATTIANDAVTYAKMQNVTATSRLLGRKTGGAGDAEECTLSETLDFVGSAAQGDILYRNATVWTRLGAGTNGHFLKTQGAAADPVWAAASGSGAVATDGIWDVKGDLAVGTGADTASRLAVGTNGQVLTADSAEATGLKWTTVSGTGDVVGPASATDNAIVRFDTTTGKLIQNSAVTIADTSGNMAGVGTLNTHTIPGGTGTLALTSDITGTNSGTNTGDVTLAAIGSSPNANAASLTGQALTLQPASASFGGVVTTGTQSFVGTKTFTGDMVLSANLTATTSTNSTLTGSNQRIPTHSNFCIRFTNVSLTSIASANITGVIDGHILMITNLTGATITLVDNYGGAAGGEAIRTGTTADLKLPNASTQFLRYDTSAAAWLCVSTGLVDLATSMVTGVLPNANTTATNANTASAIVARDASGNFSAGTITASLTGNASTVTTNANLTGHITSTGNAAVLGSFTSAQLATALTDETGSGAAVFATSPTLVTPLLGTPTSGVLTNCTGTASGLTAGNVTTNANLTGAVTSSGNATTLVSALPLSIPGTGAANQTIYADAKAAFGYTINSILGAGTSAGSISLAVKINGTNVTGLSAVSITSTPADSNATAANVVAVGDTVTWVFTSNSTATDLRFTMKITRT